MPVPNRREHVGRDFYNSQLRHRASRGMSPGSGGDVVSVSEADPWTNVVLGSDFTISTTTITNVTDLNFTPAADKNYLVEFVGMLRTANATVGAQPGFSFPTGLDDSSAKMEVVGASETASIARWWGDTSDQSAAQIDMPSTADSWLCIGKALLIVGATPSGDFDVTLAAEFGSVNVTMRAGSVLRYREI